MVFLALVCYGKLRNNGTISISTELHIEGCTVLYPKGKMTTVMCKYKFVCIMQIAISLGSVS